MSSTALQVVFWLGFLIVFYAYLGYGLVLFLLRRSRPRRAQAASPETLPLPEVTLVVCAYNEKDWIGQKIANSLALDYPAERLHFLYVTDGSDDGTDALVRQYSFPPATRWSLMHQPERRGKIAAFQRAMAEIQTPIVVSTDANALLNPEALRRMVRHFADPAVGAVAGEKRISMPEKAGASSAGEGIYWKYESTLKKWDAELWSVVGAAGELFAFRRDVYEHVPSDTIVEDFYLTMRIAQKGWRVAYEPGAYAVEGSSISVSEELKRKVRIAAGSLQAIVRLAPLLNVFRYGWLSFQYISHRVLRWTLAPLALPMLLIVNILLWKRGIAPYGWLLLAQLLFYAAALAGHVLEQRRMKLKVFFVPYYFCVMNYAQYMGFFRYLRGNQSVLWEKAGRAK
jgi:cellulose synthase/poly-beta-1,6-N-acetylglucosamine synthase-like glycosyltransferase